MKHGKKATHEQRKLIQRCGLDTREWLVAKDTSTEMVLVHRHTGTVKTITKEGF